MKKIILSGLVFFGMAADAANVLVGIPIESASALSKLMKPAIEAKDGPAACWFLGQVHGYSLALKNSRGERRRRTFQYGERIGRAVWWYQHIRPHKNIHG